MTFDMGDLLQRAMGFWRSRRQPRHALALAGGGVIGGMYEVGAVAALEERLSGSSYFQVYVGCSAGAVRAAAPLRRPSPRVVPAHEGCVVGAHRPRRCAAAARGEQDQRGEHPARPHALI